VAYKISLDESGIEDGARIVVVAGRGATSLRLSYFQKRWMKTIRNAGLRELKSKEFFDRVKARRWESRYAGWNDQKAIQFMYKLISLVRNLNALTVGTAMVVDDFWSFEKRLHRQSPGRRRCRYELRNYTLNDQRTGDQDVVAEATHGWRLARVARIFLSAPACGVNAADTRTGVSAPHDRLVAQPPPL
jgi:hypothetical protein